jgi:hypothetical protein
LDARNKLRIRCDVIPLAQLLSVVMVIMKHFALILAAAVGLITSACNSQAGIGWTLDESIQHYGQPLMGPNDVGMGCTSYGFKTKGYMIVALYRNEKVVCITYMEPSNSGGARNLRMDALDEATVKAFLAGNGPDAVWTSATTAEKTTPDGSDWVGKVNEKPAYQAHLNDDRAQLIIMTQEFSNVVHTEGQAQRTAHENEIKGM